MAIAVEPISLTASSVAQRLRVLQSDATVLYFKLRSYHWNVTGNQFFHLHELFEKLYDETAELGDTLAERLVATGAAPVATLAEQLRMARLREDPSPNTPSMVANILTDLERMTASLRELAQEAERAQDPATKNLAESIADKNEKTLWMLRAYLK